MNNPEKVNNLHEQAMTIADEAFLAERAQEIDRAVELYQQAFELEKQVASHSNRCQSLQLLAKPAPKPRWVSV